MDLPLLFKCLSDPTRLRILNLLVDGPLCVCQIQDALHEPQVKTSKHLAYMRERGLLQVARKANWSYYEIDWKAHPAAKPIILSIRENAPQDPLLKKDLESLAAPCC